MSTPRSTSSTPSRRALSPARRTVALALANVVAYAGIGLMLACSDAPTSAPDAPAPGAAARDVLAAPVYATGLRRDVPLAAPVVASFWVDADGGRYSVPGTGLSITTQPGDIKQGFLLTVTALPGDVVAYEFGPAGMKFPKGLSMQQELQHTNWDAGGSFEVGYFADTSDVSVKTNKTLVKEFVRANFDTRGQRLSWSVFHFSGYMVSTGRTTD